MIDRFIEHIETELRYSPLTVRNYRRDVNMFAQWFVSQRGCDSFDATAVDAEDVRNYIIYRLDTAELSSASMNRELSSIKSFFRYLRGQKVVSADFMKRVNTLRTPENLPVFVPQTRMRSLLDYISEQTTGNDIKEHRKAIIISLFYGCGIRLAELCNIKVGDVSDTTIKVLGKGEKERIIPLLPGLKERIDEYIDHCKECGVVMSSSSPLIFGRQDKSLSRSTVQRIVAEEMERVGIQGRKSPHVLRHTFATHLLDGGADMREIQELLGHSSLRTTQHYTHNSITQLQGIYKKAHPHK